MSTIIFTASTWDALFAQPDSATRAQAFADAAKSIDFLDATDTLIRNVAITAWSVGAASGGKTTISPSGYTDAAAAAGTPAAAVFKDSGGAEIARCSAGTAAGNFYRLLANFAIGVPLIPGGFGITFSNPAAPGTFEPSNTTAPSISGTAQVGSVLTAAAGAWTGNPIPVVARQWLRNGFAIAGATGTVYTTQQDDLGASITFRETATNSVGSKSATSNAIGPIQAEPLRFENVPSPIPLSKGGTFPLGDYVKGGTPPYGNYAVDTGSLPAEITLDANTGVLTATSAAVPETTGDMVFGVDDNAVPVSQPGALPQFGVLSAVGGTNLPFTYGHVFKNGDVPAGSYVDSDLTDWQAIPTTYWPDGSVRHAIISGRATCTANVEKKITLSASIGTGRAGTALALSDMRNSPAVEMDVQAGGETIRLELVKSAAPHRTVCAGPVMINAIWRAPVPNHATLVVWFDVRLYKGGAVEVFPWVENVASIATAGLHDMRTWIVSTAGGTVERFNRSIEVKYRTRIPLLYNVGLTFKHWTYWIGQDPQIVPIHDVAYLQATKMVPNYGWAPSEAQLTTITDAGRTGQSFTPTLVTEVDGGMANTSHMHYVGPLSQWDAYWAASADTRAFNRSMKGGLEFGAWPIHFRESATSNGVTTENEPLIYYKHRTAQVAVGRWNEDAYTAANGQRLTFDDAHQPSIGYAAWLSSARWFFVDEMMMWAFVSFLVINPGKRGYENGVIGEWLQIRAIARLVKNLGHLLSTIPEDHPLRPQFVNQMEKTMDFHRARYVDSTSAWYSPIGVIFALSNDWSTYDKVGDYWWDAQWQIVQGAETLAWMHNMDLPIAEASKTKMHEVAQHGLKFAVGLWGPEGGDATGKSYRVQDYHLPIAYDWTGWPPERWLEWTEIEQTALPLQRTVNGVAFSPPVGTSMWYVDPGPGTAVEIGGPDSGWNNTSGICYPYAALAMAVEKMADGAEAAWSRVTSSSTWATRGPYFGPWAFWPRNKAKPQ